MGLHAGAYAKIWNISKPEGKNYYTAEMSISRKNADGEYQTDWSDKFVRAVGNAAKQIESGAIKKGDRVQIGSCDVTNFFSKEKERVYTTYTVFEFTVPDNAKKSEKTASKTKSSSTSSASEEDDYLPFS